MHTILIQNKSKVRNKTSKTASKSASKTHQILPHKNEYGCARSEPSAAATGTTSRDISYSNTRLSGSPM